MKNKMQKYISFMPMSISFGLIVLVTSLIMGYISYKDKMKQNLEHYTEIEMSRMLEDAIQYKTYIAKMYDGSITDIDDIFFNISLTDHIESGYMINEDYIVENSIDPRDVGAGIREVYDITYEKLNKALKQKDMVSHKRDGNILDILMSIPSEKDKKTYVILLKYDISDGVSYLSDTIMQESIRIFVGYTAAILFMVFLLYLAFYIRFKKIQEVAGKISQLDFAAARELNEFGSDELATLAKSLSTMARNLEETTQEISLKKEEIKVEKDLTSEYLKLARVGIVISDPEGYISTINTEAAKIISTKQGAALDKKLFEYIKNNFIAEKYRVEWDNAVLSVDIEKIQEIEVDIEDEQGVLKTVDIKSAFIHNTDGGIVNIISSVEDITQRKATERKLENMAHYDSLTKLVNKHKFNSLLDEELEKSRTHSTSFSVFFLDLDRFKNINDTLGHQAGDELLKSVAVQLQSSVKKTDIVSRISGDEFAIILKNTKSHKDVESVLKRILKNIAKPINVVGTEIYTTCSIGAVSYPDDGVDVMSLMKSADIAMYEAKDSGKNNYIFFDKEMLKNVSIGKDVEYELRTALKADGLPIKTASIQTSKGSTNYAIEYMHDTKKIEKEYGISQQQVGELIKEHGLTMDVGEYILEHACKQKASISKMPKIMIEISTSQFVRSDLIKDIKERLVKHDVSPKEVIFLVKEDLIKTSTKDMINKLKKFKEEGYDLALDGYSINETVMDRVIDLKMWAIIPPSITTAHVKDKKVQALLRATAIIAQEIGVAALLRGSSTEETAKWADENGFKYITKQ